MSLETIKVVAGGGKTTESETILKSKKNGIYLAFNNKVVDTISSKGFLSKTIDSLFVSFIIPKMISVIPIASNPSEIEYFDINNVPGNMKGVSTINIDLSGKIFNNNHDTGFTISNDNNTIHNMPFRTNLSFVKYIFDQGKMRLNDKLRSDLCAFLINNYSNYITKLLESRFDFIIIDEAQDLSGFREEFAKLLSSSKIELIVLGDDNQRINQGGDWFCGLTATKTKNYSFRCPEDNCRWIREILKVNIFGNNNSGGVTKVSVDDVLEYDNGKRTLLYQLKTDSTKNIIDNWSGDKYTIKTAKGMTIDQDIVIIGKTLNLNNMYTAVTRTVGKVYLTAELKK
ncbi:MAG: UvrD-helicase domain-containing protein [Acholeplasmatales bacterium]|nr:UvrD-helicase domain-containing protein [Acholeplasmatales bacterium]